jgi:hypothetical protein
LEILIYITLVAMAFSAIGLVLQSGLATRSLAAAQIRLVEQQRLVEWTLLSRLEQSGGMTTPASGTSTTLQIESPTASENPVTFAVSGNVLTMQLGTNPAVNLTPSDVRVTNFTVERLDGSPASLIIMIEFETDTASGTVVSETSTITYTLRYD